MPPRLTRSKSSKSTIATNDATTEPPPAKNLERDEDIHRVCILPTDAGKDSQIVYLSHPATSGPAAFLFCPTTGRLHEFTKVSAGRKSPHSLLVAPESRKDGDPSAEDTFSKTTLHNGYVMQDADVLVATPFDPLFLLTSLLSTGKARDRPSFRLVDDYLEILSEKDPNFARLLRIEHFATSLRKRLEALSDVQDIGDDKFYRPSIQQFVRALVSKASSMIRNEVWPSSIEEGLIKKELEVPVVQHVQLTEESTEVPTKDSMAVDHKVGGATKHDNGNEQGMIAPAVLDQMRVRKAFDYLMATYVPVQLRPELRDILNSEEVKSSNALLDFRALDDHLERVKIAKAEAVALRSLSDNISRKRGMDDEETADARAEKRRKKEEEDKKAKMESRATKALKKVDTSGMRKLSSFFTKAPPKKQQPA